MNERMRALIARFEKRNPVLHTGLGIVGIPTEVHAPGEYVDPNGNRIDQVVLVLHDGNACILREGEDEIVEVSPTEVVIYEQTVEALRSVITGAVVAMGQRADQKRMPIALALVNAAVAAQLRALRTGSP